MTSILQAGTVCSSPWTSALCSLPPSIPACPAVSCPVLVPVWLSFLALVTKAGMLLMAYSLQPERRGSLIDFAEDEFDELTILPVPRRVDVEQLEHELQQKQRRNSLQMRRTSLADVIPDWPLLLHRTANKVHTAHVGSSHLPPLHPGSGSNVGWAMHLGVHPSQGPLATHQHLDSHTPSGRLCSSF